MSSSPLSPELLLREAGFVRRLAASLLQDPHLAEDVSQETLMAAMSGGPRSVGKLRPWLAKVTRNFAAHSIRSRARSQARDQDHEPPQGAPSPEDVLQREQLRSEVVQAVLALPTKYREPILLRYYEDLDPKSIAARLQLPLETTRTRLRRGRERLRQELQEQGQGLAALVPALGWQPAVLQPAAGLLPVAFSMGLAKVAALCAVASGIWFLWPTPEPMLDLAGPSPLVPEETERLADLGPVESAPQRQPGAGATAPEDAPAIQVRATQESRQDLPRRSVELVLVDPDRRVIELDQGTLVLRDAESEELRVPIEQAHKATVSLEVDRPYLVQVEAPGFDHYEQDLRLAIEGSTQEHLVLWPQNWVALRVRSADGRNTTQLAEELGLEPKRILVHALRAKLALQAPSGTAPSVNDGAQLATFHEPPTWQSWSLPGDIIGSLELHSAPPMWVGLHLYGEALEWKPLVPGQRLVDFVVEPEDFDARFASLDARVVDALSGAGLGDVEVTFKAETSAHRRHEHTKVKSDAQGHIRMRRIVPGRYGLTVECDGGIHQSWLNVAAGDRLDLGDIALRRDSGIPLEVVDVEGHPLAVFVELAPYQAGAATEDLYHPNLHRFTGPDGRYSLPFPTSPSILRVTQLDHHLPGYEKQRSANYLLDPNDPPRKTLRIPLLEPARLRVEAVTGVEGRIELVDSLGLVVFTQRSIAEAWAHYMVPGEYEARLVGRGEQITSRATVQLAPEGAELRLP